FMNSGSAGINGVMEEYLGKAYIENPQLKALRSAIKASDEAMPQAISGFLPRVDVNLTESFTRSSDGNRSKENFTPSGQSLDVRQNLFAGMQSIYQIKSAKDRIISARYELRNEEQNFLRQAIETYVNLIFAKKVLTLNQKNEKVLSDQVTSTRDRFLIGDATRTDVAQSEARLANAVSSRISAENEFVNSKSQFRRVFLVDAPENLSMPTKLPAIPATLDDALNTAISNNPEIQRNLYAKNQRANEVEVQKSQLYPQLDLTGSIAQRESVNGNSIFSNEQESIGLNLRVPLYDSGVTFSRTREAKDRKNQSEFEYQNSVITTRDSVIRAWQALATATLNIEATKASILAAEYAIDGVRAEQKEGQRTVFDVLLAEQDRFNAEVAHARAIRDSILAVYNLKASVGQLNASELSLAVAEYNPEEHYEKTKLKFFGF
ncbi:MAG: TolC family outer membrane protein, partial [Rickettsiales bacterium]|nr:TolC family outer membrane protein [Rickettsiales bacterium]